MKKIISFFIVLTLMFVCCACVEPDVGPVCGGWNEAEDTTITEELKEIFNKGTASYTGIELEPLSLKQHRSLPVRITSLIAVE